MLFRSRCPAVCLPRETWGSFLLHHRAEDTPLDIVVTLSFDANWTELTLRYLTDYRTRRATKDRLFSAILDAFEQSGGKVKVAAPVLQINELPPLSLKRTA